MELNLRLSLSWNLISGDLQSRFAQDVGLRLQIWSLRQDWEERGAVHNLPLHSLNWHWR